MNQSKRRSRSYKEATTLGSFLSKFSTGENMDGWFSVLMAIGRGILVEVGDD
jgi:hypothetical protein